MSRKDTRRNNKLNKIITRLGDLKFDISIPESGLVITLQEKKKLRKKLQKSVKRVLEPSLMR